MAFPPKGDVTRPVFLAARSMRLLGILCLILSTCLLAGSVFAIGGAASAPTRTGGPPSAAAFLGVFAVVMVALTALYVAIGVTFIVCSVKIKQGKRWAVTTGIVLASIAAAFSGLGLALGLFQVITSGAGPRPDEMISLVFNLIFFAAFAQLVVHLKQSYEGIDRMGYQQQRGFDVVMPTAQPYNPQQYPPRR
jgi:hypothetical protein